MCPDRVIVGELRCADTVPLCAAMTHGGSGWMTTVQAASASGALARMAAGAMQAPEFLPVGAANLLVAGAVHVVVHLHRADAGRRVVSAVHEVVGADHGQITTSEVYRRDPGTRSTPGSAVRVEKAGELVSAGVGPAR